MSEIARCRECKRPIGNLSDETNGLCPRCLRSKPTMVDEKDKKSDIKDKA